MVQTRSSDGSLGNGGGPTKTALVTGGGGFLGHHLVQQLLENGNFNVRVFDIRQPEPERSDARVQYIVGDLRKADQVSAACKGVDVVFHTATASPTGANAYNKALMESVNVDGTQNVIDSCISNRVCALVYTSSASVVFQGRDLMMVNEDTPYAARPLDFYTVTKIRGEELVLQANGQNGLAVCALRPSGIFGEHDPLLVPTTVAKARAGKMKYIIGNGENLMDWTYVGNVAQAHIAAADLLLKHGTDAKAAGKAYFITNDDPKPFWGFMGDVCEGLGYGRPRIHLPVALVMCLALIMQYIIIPLLRPFKQLETDLTPFRITVASVNRTFDCSRAKRDLGYLASNKISMDEALKKTLKHFEHLKASNKELPTKNKKK